MTQCEIKRYYATRIYLPLGLGRGVMKKLECCVLIHHRRNSGLKMFNPSSMRFSQKAVIEGKGENKPLHDVKRQHDSPHKLYHRENRTSLNKGGRKSGHGNPSVSSMGFCQKLPLLGAVIAYTAQSVSTSTGPETKPRYNVLVWYSS